MKLYVYILHGGCLCKLQWEQAMYSAIVFLISFFRLPDMFILPEMISVTSFK